MSYYVEWSSLSIPEIVVEVWKVYIFIHESGQPHNEESHLKDECDMSTNG